MKIFNRGAPTTFVPDGYQLDLDRMPPGGGASCFKLLLMIGAFVGVIFGAIFLIVSVVRAGSQPAPPPTPTVAAILETTPEVIDATATPTPSPTLDDWSATGTALVEATASSTFTPTATADYCGWLTPTPTHTPTLIYTPDDWAKTGTAVFYLTNTPTPELEPTATTPRSWCDYTPGPTNTPRREYADVVKTQAAQMTPTLTPTSTARRAFPTVDTSGPSGPGNAVSPPIVPPTSAPPVSVEPTLPLPTMVKTKRPTRTPTATITNTPTATATATATYTPSATWTVTNTPTETPTNTPTPTNTALPIVAIVSTSCAAGYPTFTIQNLGALPGNLVLFDIRLGDLVAASGYWHVELSPFASVIAAAPMWAGVPGVYVLSIYQPWDVYVPIQSAAVACTGKVTTAAPTATATLLPEVTTEFTPTLTPTIEVTP
jgi:hypothetical protein